MKTCKSHDQRLVNGFLHMIPKAAAVKEKKNKFDFIKIKNFCASKYTIKKVKRQSKEWKKIFANHLFIKDIMSRIYNEPFQYNNKK